jgi:hypothetical protein
MFMTLKSSPGSTIPTLDSSHSPGNAHGCQSASGWWEEIDHPLALWQPWAFPGEWELSSVGIVEPGLDFNPFAGECPRLPERQRMVDLLPAQP